MSPIISALLVSIAAAPSQTPAPAPTADAEALLRESDRARGGLAEGITWTVEITSTEDGVSASTTYLVRARGNDALAEVTAPARSKGEKLLFNDRTIWFVKPGLKKPVSISARQRLSGQAANGDIAATNYARDYASVVAGEDVVEGAVAWRLELTARSPSVTYDRIRYWVSKAGRHALKAEFLTVSGDVFKTAVFAYGNTVTVAGAPLELVKSMTITDAMGTGAVSVLRFSSPKAEVHSPAMFNVNNVVR